MAGEADLAGIDIARPSASAIGTGGMVTKVEAARIATGAGIPVVLTAAERAAEALAGDAVGTRFLPTGRRRPTRLLWLAHASDTQGALHVDDGAVRALTMRKASLLPAGITGVTGTFIAGDPVDVVAHDGTVVARGLVNYDSAELPQLLGRSTRDLAAELGADYEREVVHRDDLVIVGAAERGGNLEWTAMKEQVHEAARRARLAATTLATLPRSAKDAALLAAADALVAATDDVLAANALDVEAARAGGTPEHVIDRLALDPGSRRRVRPGPARRRRPARPGRRDRARVDAAQRPAHAAGPRARSASSR